MVTATSTRNRMTIAQRQSQIRTRWTPQERHQRVIEGRRQYQELVRLITVSQPEPEIWATGALTVADLQRLVG